jgi:ASCH domain
VALIVLGVRLRTLTIRQPWAEYIIAGEKDVENRTWTSSHRGLLGVHAGRNGADLREMDLDPADFVLGALVGVVELVDIVRDHPSQWAEDDCWHWLVTRPRRLAEPMPLRGALGLFTVDIPELLLPQG